MADFFGGILDSLRSATSSASSFFDDALSVVGLSGSDIIKAGAKTLKDGSFGSGSGSSAGGAGSVADTSVMSTLNGAKYQAGKTEALKSVDPKEMEANWIRRMQAFSEDK